MNIDHSVDIFKIYFFFLSEKSEGFYTVSMIIYLKRCLKKDVVSE